MDLTRVRSALQEELGVEESNRLIEIGTAFVLSHNLWKMVRELGSLTKQRKLWRGLTTAFQARADGDNSAAAEELFKTLKAARDLDASGREGPVPIVQSLKEFQEEMSNYFEGERPIVYSTGFEAVDEYFKYTPRCLYVVAARPAMGKTAWALEQALVLSRQGLRGLFVSIEMGREELSRRLVTAKTGIPGLVIRDGLVDERNLEQIQQIVEEYANLGLAIVDKGVRTVEDIRFWLDSAPEGQEYQYLVVDYIGLLQGGNGKDTSREQIVGDNSWALKTIAKEYGLPVIALAQLNREVTNRKDKRPTLSDIRESGRIEQDADVVALLHREDYYTDDPPVFDTDRFGNRVVIAELIVAKNRHGRTGTARVGFNPVRTLFTQLTREAQYRQW